MKTGYFFRNIFASSKRRRNEEEQIHQNSAFYEDEIHTENAMIANVAQSVEIIVNGRDKQRVVRKAIVDRTQQKE